jgi:hypothetical protein
MLQLPGTHRGCSAQEEIPCHEIPKLISLIHIQVHRETVQFTSLQIYSFVSILMLCPNLVLRFPNCIFLLRRMLGSRSGGYEDFYLLGYNAMKSSQRLRGTCCVHLACFLLHVGFLLDLDFNTEDGGIMFLRNFG